uniref:Protein kinase domain-containing protein n=1 Tax=Panagrolaimus sp. ES5 TaxID=591445 RepID=A0AC34G4S3_9BILA
MDSITVEFVAGWINGYIEEIGLIGKGSYSVVSRCKIKNSSKFCVMKKLREMFDFQLTKNEIDVMILGARCRYIPDLYFAGFNVDNHYIILMEDISGGSLRHHIFYRSLISEEAIKVIAFQIADALNFLHELCYVHGDIKDDNVALTSNGEVRLLDFGFSTNVWTPQRLRQQCLEYASPEVIKCHKASYPSDWWSYGCLLADLIQKRGPFRENDILALHNKIFKGEPNLEKIKDESAKDLIQKLLRKNPAERFQNVFNHPYLESAKSKPIFIPGNLYHAKMRDAEMKDAKQYNFRPTLRIDAEMKEAKQYNFRPTLRMLNTVFSDGYIVCPTEEQLNHFLG